MWSYKSTAIACATAFALSATAATAAVIDINSISGTWDSIVADNEYTPNPYRPNSYSPSDDAGTSRIQWGWEYNDGPSAYLFTPSATPIMVDDPLGGSELKIIGEFTHENRPIIVGGPVLRSAELELRIEGEINGESFVFTPKFLFQHNETLNNGGNDGICEVGSTPCADIVTVGNAISTETLIEAGGERYRMYLDGFVDALGGVPRQEFFTDENKDNTSLVQWRIIRDPISVIPLPATAWLLFAGIGGLAVASRRRRTNQ